MVGSVILNYLQPGFHNYYNYCSPERSQLKGMAEPFDAGIILEPMPEK